MCSTVKEWHHLNLFRPPYLHGHNHKTVHLWCIRCMGIFLCLMPPHNVITSYFGGTSKQHISHNPAAFHIDPAMVALAEDVSVMIKV